jgi:hypothetical protein
MSVIEAYVKHAAESAEYTATERVYDCTWIVRTNDAYDAALTILAAVPGLGTVWSYGDSTDNGAFCNTIRPRRIDELVWEVDLSYSTIAADPQKNPVPTQRPAKRRWKSAMRDTFPLKDLSKPLAKPFCNSAYYVYEDRPPTPKPYGVLSIVRNEAAFDWRTALSYTGKLNSTPFYGANPGHVLVAAIDAEEDQSENGYTFATVSYELWFRDNDDETWNEPVLDQGPYWIEKLDGGSTIVKHFKDSDDEEYASTTGFLLDGNGGKLSESDKTAGNYSYRDFTFYASKDLSPLRLQW